MFKKKVIKGAGRRKKGLTEEILDNDVGIKSPLDDTGISDQVVETAETQLESNKVARKIKPRQTFKKFEQKTRSKWVTNATETTQDLDLEAIGVAPEILENFTEGATMNAEDLDPDTESLASLNIDKPAKFVPKLDESLTAKLSKREQLSQLVNEYEEEEDQIETDFATIDPEPEIEQIDMDDEIADQEYKVHDIDEDVYDLQIGTSDDESTSNTFKPVMSLPEQMNKLEKLLESMKISKVQKTRSLEENSKVLKELEVKRALLVSQLT